MSIASFINTPVLYVTKLTKNQNNSINLILQYGRVVEKDCCIAFSASEFHIWSSIPDNAKGR